MLGCLGSCWIPVKLMASHLDVYLIIVYDFFLFFFYSAGSACFAPVSSISCCHHSTEGKP